MIALWRAECQKTKGRHLLLFVAGMTVVELMWLISGKPSEDAILKGWFQMLYQMPLLNELILSMTALLIASRLGDLEHKNGMLKQLCCITERGKLYDVKLLYGFSLILFGIVAGWFIIIADGMFGHHYGGSFPARDYLLILLFTMVTTFAVYALLYAVALCNAKPAAPYIVGIIGAFLGLLSMFLSQFPWLRKVIPWGYYGVLMFVGSDYDRATRISTYYYLDIDWGGFCMVVAMGLAIYLVGRTLFCYREI